MYNKDNSIFSFSHLFGISMIICVVSSLFNDKNRYYRIYIITKYKQIMGATCTTCQTAGAETELEEDNYLYEP